jgi:hypothetical protein
MTHPIVSAEAERLISELIRHSGYAYIGASHERRYSRECAEQTAEALVAYIAGIEADAKRYREDLALIIKFCNESINFDATAKGAFIDTALSQDTDK